MSTTTASLPKSWPATARDIVLDAARFFYRQMNEPFAVYDVHMDEALEYVNREIDKQRRYIYEEASDRWINRWESGQTDAEVKKAIDATYGKLRRAERGIRPRSVSSGARKKSGRQLDVEIAHALKQR